MLTQHLADCLAVIPPLQRRAGQGRLLDVGSGGGLPGVVIATLLPRLDVTCVDAVGKKAAFVRQVAGALALPNLHAVHAASSSCRRRPSTWSPRAPSPRWPTSRALTRRHLAPGGVWMAMKGRVPDDEMAALPPDVEVFHVEPLHGARPGRPALPGLDATRRAP